MNSLLNSEPQKKALWMNPGFDPHPTTIHNECLHTANFPNMSDGYQYVEYFRIFIGDVADSYPRNCEKWIGKRQLAKISQE